MPRLLAIDYGTKRVGLAVTDELQIIASALATVPAAEALAFIKNYAAANPLEGLVIGRPLRTDGSPSENLAHVEAFMKQLQTALPSLPISTIDERFSSQEADRVKLASGKGKMARRDKGMTDRIAAVLILQTFMEQRNFFNQRK